ncbi:MAG TPA: alpha/beta fold hydrolase [Oligoflexia bacterium]|nr:alpha/beta fold hydrolase [Oligoflexia bacterium]HMP48578.1 alpha/beta fold hydrolase [Oligoflexia bacterium]
MSTSHCSVLVLHGLTARPDHFLNLKHTLESTGHICFVPHLSGHRTNHPHASEVNLHGLDLELDGYIKFLKKTPDEKIIIIGQSMGALLAIRLAARYPELVQGIILVSPSMILRSRFLQVINALISFLPRIITGSLGTIAKSKISTAHSDSSGSYPLTLVKHLGTLRRQAFKRLPDLSCPVKVIQNKGDYHLSPYSGIVIKEKAGVNTGTESDVQLALRSWGELHSLLGVPEVIEMVKTMISDILNKDQSGLTKGKK